MTDAEKAYRNVSVAAWDNCLSVNGVRYPLTVATLETTVKHGRLVVIARDAKGQEVKPLFCDPLLIQGELSHELQ